MTGSPLPETGEHGESRALPFIEQRNIHPVLFAFLCLAVIFILYQVVGGIVAFFLTGGAMVTPQNVNLVRLFTLLGQVFLIFVPTLFLARLLSKDQREIFPLRAPSWRESLSAVIALLSLQRVFEVYVYVQDSLAIPEFIRKLIDPIRQMMDQMVKALIHSGSAPEFFYVVVVVALVPCIVEEFLFRGLIQKSFDRVASPLTSAILTGTIFGLFHLNPFEAIPLIGIGCFLGILRYRSASILLPVLMHFLNNLLAVIATTLRIEDEKIMLAPATDQPGTIIILSQFLLFGALFWASMRFYFQVTERVVKNQP
ncbi:MAG TPA: CPBP family intramembrane glutamic endopeptidase [Bacteroidota bacterium]|nr:CPBP family intramembrane glutamic endopeptidase [Bacteroidota bacterium]